MRSMRPIRMKKPARAKKAGPAKKDVKLRWWTSPAVITTAIVVLIGAAMLIAGAQSSPDATAATSVGAKAVDKTADHAADRAEAKRLGMSPGPAAAPAPARARTPAAHADDPDTAPSDSKEAAATVPPVTITGCLERDDEMFRLKDASGTGVPKARSWKSGFLKKSTPSIEVVDSANRLPSHVGERVSITGTLLDRRMTVRSLQRVAVSCDGSSKSKA